MDENINCLICEDEGKLIVRKIRQFEEQAQHIYEMARSEGFWQNKKDVPFTGFDIFLSQYQKFWNPNQNNVVVFSW